MNIIAASNGYQLLWSFLSDASVTGPSKKWRYQGRPKQNHLYHVIWAYHWRSQTRFTRLQRKSKEIRSPLSVLFIQNGHHALDQSTSKKAEKSQRHITNSQSRIGQNHDIPQSNAQERKIFNDHSWIYFG